MREPTKKIEKEQPERERRKPGECDGLEAKQKKQVKEEQVLRGPELTIEFSQEVIGDLGKNSFMELN